ncbi:MAG: autotransporter-associated beta strand repeat-containing protein [Verrucomicrobiales bacterium]
MAVVAFFMLAVAEFGARGRAETLYWDTDGSSAGNNASSGANLGGSDIWSTADANWWDTNLGTLQVWIDGSDAVFWGTAGAVTASTVSANSLAFKTTGYSVNSGTLAMTGAPSNFNVDTGVTATISSTIAGANTMVKLGAGTLILSNAANVNTANTFAGGWRIEGGGTLRISADGSLGAPLPDTARNTVTDIQLNQSTIQAGATFDLDINRRTKINTNSTTNLGDGVIDTHGNVLTWYGSIQGGVGSLRITNSGGTPGRLVLGTDKKNSINPFGSALPAGTVNLTVQDGAIVQTSGTVTPTNGELGSETGAGGAVLAIKLDDGQIRSESGGYFFQRNLIVGAGGGSLDTGVWEQTFIGTVSGTGLLSKEGSGRLTLDNTSGTWTGGTRIRGGTLELGRRGSNGLLPGTLANPSSVVVHSGATLKFNRGSSKSFFDTISGAGGITVANSTTARVRLVSNNTYTGPTTISSGSLMIGQGNAGEPGSIVSSVVNNNATLIFNRVEDLTYVGAISGPGTMEKQGAGKLTLTGTHSYTGVTTVSAGTLLVNGSLSSPVSVQTAGTLGGTGTVGGNTTIDGRLAPGAGIGTLRINGNCTWNGHGSPTMLFELGNSGSDKLEITGAFTKGTGTSYQFDFLGTGAGITNGTVITLATFASTNFTAANFSHTNLAFGYSGTFSIAGGTLQFQVSSLTPLQSWRLAHFGTTADSGDAADFANPDGDEYVNLLEFVRDGDPNSSGTDGKMVSKFTTFSATSYFALTLPILVGATFSGAGEKVSAAVGGIIYRIQGSPDLVDFTTTPVFEVTPAISAGMPALSPGWEYRTFRLAADSQGFLRLAVIAAP